MQSDLNAFLSHAYSAISARLAAAGRVLTASVLLLLPVPARDVWGLALALPDLQLVLLEGAVDGGLCVSAPLERTS